MKKALVLYFFALVFLPMKTFGQSGAALTIDETIMESMKYFSTKLPSGMTVVVLNIQSENENLSSYIIDECGAFIKNNTELSLVDKSRLSIITQERNIKDLNEIDEHLALEIGKELGAQCVILGGLLKMDEIYRFRLQALGTQLGQILGIHSLNVKEDEILTDLLESGAQKTADNSSLSDSALVALQIELKRTQEQLTRQRLEAEAEAERLARQSEIETKKENGAKFVFSFRPEFVSETSVMGAGASIELGGITENSVYFTGEFSGGRNYVGIGFNIGGCLNKDGAIKNVFGISAGLHGMAHIIDFTKNGEILTSQVGSNISVAGGFYKIMFGKKKNFDVTNKLLFGFRRNPVSYKHSIGYVTYEDGLNMTYILSIGYTLTKSKR
jgi:hypothetical protein